MRPLIGPEAVRTDTLGAIEDEAVVDGTAGDGAAVDGTAVDGAAAALVFDLAVLPSGASGAVQAMTQAIPAAIAIIRDGRRIVVGENMARR